MLTKKNKSLFIMNMNNKASSTKSSVLKSLKTTFLTATFAGVMLIAEPAIADMTVCTGGCAYANIQNAINAAPDNETIRIRPGIYNEKLSITNKQLRLIGAGSAVTVIDGTGILDTSSPVSKRVISLNCATEKKIIIDGLTITGGIGEFGTGGGGLENYGCKVTLDNSLITGNGARGAGGILNSGIMNISNTVISNNNAVDLGGGGIDNNGSLDVSNSKIINNNARSGGGGISNGGTLTGKNVTIANNNSRLGGGISNNNGATGSLVSVSILNNNATQNGGGVYNVGDLTIKYSLVLSNSANFGGGIYNKTSNNLKLVGDFVTRNNVPVDGTGDGGGLFNTNGTSVRLTESTTIVNNVPNNCNAGICP